MWCLACIENLNLLFLAQEEETILTLCRCGGWGIFWEGARHG